MRVLDVATFAGGCFWCMEDAFRKVKGVVKVVSGYTGGNKDSPTYEDVCSGVTGHYESIQVEFDPLIVKYEELLEIFWNNIDPTDTQGQFSDKGSQYKTAIFYHNEAQRKKAQYSKKRIQNSGKYEKPIVTEIKKASKFYEAEEYHQDYSRKNPKNYGAYKEGSGRACYKK